jgi:hypothetical protein
MLIWLLLMLVNMHSHQHLNHQNNDFLLFFPSLLIFLNRKKRTQPNFFASFFLARSRCDTLLLIDHCCLCFFFPLLFGMFFSSTTWFVFLLHIWNCSLSLRCVDKNYFLLYVLDVYVYTSKFLHIYIYTLVYSFFFLLVFFFSLSCMLTDQLRFFLPKYKKNTTVIKNN